MSKLAGLPNDFPGKEIGGILKVSQVFNGSLLRATWSSGPTPNNSSWNLGMDSLPALGASQQSLISQYPPNLFRRDRETRRHPRYFAPFAPPHFWNHDPRKFFAHLLERFVTDDALRPFPERGVDVAGSSKLAFQILQFSPDVILMCGFEQRRRSVSTLLGRLQVLWKTEAEERRVGKECRSRW